MRFLPFIVIGFGLTYISKTISGLWQMEIMDNLHLIHNKKIKYFSYTLRYGILSC